DDDEQVQREQEVDGLQGLDDLPRCATVEVVDVEDDAVDADGTVLALALLAPVLQERDELLEVLRTVEIRPIWCRYASLVAPIERGRKPQRSGSRAETGRGGIPREGPKPGGNPSVWVGGRRLALCRSARHRAFDLRQGIPVNADRVPGRRRGQPWRATGRTA